jgi:pyruvate,water dikinase
LKSLVGLRKSEYASYININLPNRFTTFGPVYWDNNFEGTAAAVDPLINSMQGVGCSPGIVNAKARVVFSTDEVTELSGEILVTTRTDPGWIPLYPSISGLLVERGSLLSHSAIVAREMGIPTIVGIPNLTKILKDGDRIKMDGKSGRVEILS